jgi:hypothetical protein
MSQFSLPDPFIIAFSKLSTEGPPPDHTFPAYDPIHTVHQQPPPPFTMPMAPTPPYVLKVESIGYRAYQVEIRLDEEAIQKIAYQRRKFVKEVEYLLRSMPQNMESLCVVLGSNTDLELAGKFHTVTDLFWTTVNSYLFCNRSSLIGYTAWMDGLSYTAGTSEEVLAVLQNFFFMI